MITSRFRVRMALSGFELPGALANRTADVPCAHSTHCSILTLDPEANRSRICLSSRSSPAQVRAARGIRVPGVWDNFEGAVRAILGQQVSVHRATDLAGKTGGGRFGTSGFPPPTALADADVAAIGIPGTRAAAVRPPGARSAGAGRHLPARPAGGPQFPARYRGASVPGLPNTSPCASPAIRMPSPPRTGRCARSWGPMRAVRNGGRNRGGPGVPTRSCISGAGMPRRSETGVGDVHYTWADSPVGRLLLAGTDALSLIAFSRGPKSTAPKADWRILGCAFPAPVRRPRLQDEYFQGTRREFDLDLEPAGTPFQLQVLDALATIPYGETRSYGEVAAQIGKPRAVRAVGAANGRNPLPIVLPCHRVIGADGSLTGFGGGLETKRYLLDLEGASY